MCLPLHSRVRNCRNARDIEDRHHPYDGILGVFGTANQCFRSSRPVATPQCATSDALIGSQWPGYTSNIRVVCLTLSFGAPNIWRHTYSPRLLPSPRGGVVPVTGFQSARSAFRNARSSDNCRRAATERGADSGATPSVAGTADGGAHDSTIEKPVVRAAAPPKVCRRSIVGRSYG